MRYEIFADMLDGSTSVFTYRTDQADIRIAAEECERKRKCAVLEIKTLREEEK